MLFSSLVFLFYFLPILIGVYFLAPRKGKNAVLILFSILFHAWGGISYTLLLLGSVLVNFIVAKQISKQKITKKKWLIVGIIFNTLLLVGFKYVMFFIENLNGILGFVSSDFVPFDGFKIILPLGISFFTFQQMSMLWDIHRMESPHKVTFGQTILYVIFFPQLIAGPIVRYNDIIDQIKERKENIDLFYSGVKRFILGLFKKVIIANGCAIIIDSLLKEDIAVLAPSALWLGIIAYTFQIFFDFSGYSDMAIGLGRMFGFDILENFNFPYVARSMQDFWRRWHISLSTWFRDYVYIPLGGSKQGLGRTYANLFIVFLLTGFWHGATWSFIFWGVFHGFFLILERLFLGNLLKKIPVFFGWVYMILVVVIGWVYFRVEDFGEATQYLQGMFGLTQGTIKGIYYLNEERIFVLILAIIFSIPWKKVLNSSTKISGSTAIVFELAYVLFLFAAFIYSVIYLSSDSYNPFIYFNF